MNMSLGLFSEAKLSQQLNLAPQLLNWLKLLQVPTLELNRIIQSELLANPALELSEADPDLPEESPELIRDDSAELCMDSSSLEERFSLLADMDKEWCTADDSPRLSTIEQLQDRNSYMMDSLVRAPNLYEELEQAITCSDLSGEDADLARELAGYVNDRGYLEITLAEFAKHNDISADRAWSVLLAFQEAAPPGIGARDLKECLLFQLAAMRCDTCLAERIVNHCFELLAEKEPEELCALLEVSGDELNTALSQIRMLDPDPGLAYQNLPVEYIQPDLEIRIENGDLTVELCGEQTPSLQLSTYCRRLLESRKGSRADLDYIRRKLREASFIIQGISQRQDTMLKVAREIIRVQREFLLRPGGQIKPLTMNKVAAVVGVHETTVSRAVANKYVQTPRGLIGMRAFFKVGYRCADGSSVTPEKIKEQLEALISAEYPVRPLTDEQLSMTLRKRGIKVARRTIAKYREEMGIPSSKERSYVKIK